MRVAGNPCVLRVVTLLLVGAFAAGAAAADASPPTLRVGEQRLVSLALPPPAAGLRSAQPLVIRDEGAAYVKVHFSLFDLPDGVVAEVANSDRTEVYRYGRGEQDDFTVDETLGEDGVSRFAAMSITGDTAIVRLVGTPPNGWGAHQGIRIGQYDRGLPEQAWQVVTTDVQPEAVCGVSDSRAVACYGQDTLASTRARAVARLLVGGTSLCTGWRVGEGNKMLTNNHCIGDDSRARATEAWFNYQSSTCSGQQAGAVVKVSGAQLLRTESSLDYALFTVNNANAIAQFGHLGLDVDPIAAGQNIFIAHHPGGRLKELSITSDRDGGQCKLSGTSGDSHEYTCDTEGGSSGSPVLARRSGKVIGLHYASGGQCRNIGKRVELIWPRIAGYFNNVVP